MTSVHSAGAPGVREQRKLVTALFADIVGSTPLAERLDPEDVMELVGAAVAFMIRAVERFGGTVKDLAGDGVLALFGVPVSHEDDAERAVRAGLAIVEEMSRFAGETASHAAGSPPQVRVGVESGLVVVGAVGAGHKVELGAVGDAVNTAARLQSSAAPGTVLVGRSTHRLVAPLFEWGPARDLSLGGKAGAYRAYPVERASAGTRTKRPLNADVRLVGRAAELDRLRESVVALAAGGGACVFITGEAGVGKSRLLRELEAMFRAACPPSSLWLEGRCISYGETLPYWPIAEILRTWLGAGPATQDTVVLAHLQRSLAELLGDRAEGSYPALAALLGLTPRSPAAKELATLSPEGRQQRTFSSMSAVVARLAARGPVALVVDDLHWADRSSLDLLAHLRRQTGNSPVLVACALRHELESRAWRLLETAVVGGGEHAVRVPLEGLGREGDRELLTELLGPHAVPSELERVLLATAEGNPFYLEELVRSVAEAGTLVRDADGWRASPNVRLDLPDTIEKVIVARLDRLSQASYDALTSASVLGRRFSVPLLREVVGGDGQLVEALNDLERLDLLRVEPAAGDQQFRFRHALIQETAYRLLLKRRRRELHARAARALEKLFPERVAELSPTLARHFREAGEIDSAIRYYSIAGERAATAYANAEAIVSFEAALTLIDQEAVREGERRRPPAAEVAERLGDVLELIGEHDRARESYERALAGRDGTGTPVARLQRKIGDTLQNSRLLDEALAAYDRAEAVLGSDPQASPDMEQGAEADAGWWDEWLNIYFQRIYARYWQGDSRRINDLLARVRPVLDERGTPAQRGAFLYRLVLHALRSNRYAITEETLELARAALAAAEESGDSNQVAWTRFGLGFCELFHGEIDSAEAHIGSALGYTERAGDAALRLPALVYLSIAARRQRHADRVAALAPRIREASRDAGYDTYLPVPVANRAWIAWREGELERALEHGNEALRLWELDAMAYPFQWLALWPMIAAHMATNEIERALSLARLLLEESQQPLPEALADSLRQALEAGDRQDFRAVAPLLQAALTLAARARYL